MPVVSTTTPNPNIGYFTPGLPQLTPNGGMKVPADVPNDDGVNPATGYIDAGSMLGGSIGMQEDRFYGVAPGSTPGTLLTVTATLYAYPFYIPNSIDLQTIALYTTTGQTGGAGHVGMYTDNGNGYPDALVIDSGALIATSGAAVQTATPTAPLALNPGWYWLASIFTASGTFPTVASLAVSYSSDLNSIMGSDTALHLGAASGQAATGITVAGTYGALPATFTAGAALRLNADIPLVILGT